MLADNPLNTSGVGCQARHLIEGLIKKGHWSFRVLGGAIRHHDYSIQSVNPDFVVKPVDGFGSPDLLREMLLKEKPDAIFLFTDPRFFLWVWQMEEEIHQICPIVYWHVWDNDPYPQFNEVLYESTDLINCHSHLTYNLVKDKFPEKTNFIPHALPQNVFRQLPVEETQQHKERIIGKERADHFTCIWVNRNARRKMPGNVLLAWSKFMDELEAKTGKRDATLLLHTNPGDNEGQNLPVIAERFGTKENVVYSTGRISFEEMAILYNISDCCVNVACHEGFGLSTLEAMQCGLPIIAQKTGGLTRQVIDHRDGSENGIALDPEVRNLVGGQSVPYIYEDHVSPDTVAKAFMQMYEMGPEERQRLGAKTREYVLSEFALQNTVDAWDETMFKTITNWKKNRKTTFRPWEMKTL